jgi:hypothetical protein
MYTTTFITVLYSRITQRNTNTPGNAITIKTDNLPSLSKTNMLDDCCFPLSHVDVIINSSNFNAITHINHTGIILKYAKAVKVKSVYTASEHTSNFAPAFDAQCNFRAKYPSATSDSTIMKKIINSPKFFVHSYTKIS